MNNVFKPPICSRILLKQVPFHKIKIKETVWNFLLITFLIKINSYGISANETTLLKRPSINWSQKVLVSKTQIEIIFKFTQSTSYLKMKQKTSVYVFFCCIFNMHDFLMNSVTNMCML